MKRTFMATDSSDLPSKSYSSIGRYSRTVTFKVLLKLDRLMLGKIPFPIHHLYRTYVYNLATVVDWKLSSIIQNLKKTSRKLNNSKKILFYPNLPSQFATIYQVCLFVGYKVSNNIEGYDAAIKWEDATFSPNDRQLLELSKQDNNLINIGCEDISKSYTDKIFYSVFGYGAEVDPRTYTGSCVVKSDLNYKHDGKIISCPISKVESDVVYQKLIDAGVEDNKLLEFRVPVIKQSIPLVYLYLKDSSVEKRFFGYESFISVQVNDASDVFSEDEIQNILLFCQKMGLDYCELDVLRDKADRKIYIVDANNTPSSRVLFEPLIRPLDQCLLSPVQRINILQKFAQAFEEMLPALKD